MELQPSEPNCSLVPGQESSLIPQLIAKFRQRVDTQEMCIEQGGFGMSYREDSRYGSSYADDTDKRYEAGTEGGFTEGK